MSEGVSLIVQVGGSMVGILACMVELVVHMRSRGRAGMTLKSHLYFPG